MCKGHDPAKVAGKLHRSHNSATALLRLPISYATTEHGTEFDVVGQGAADPPSSAGLSRVVGRRRAKAGRLGDETSGGRVRK